YFLVVLNASIKWPFVSSGRLSQIQFERNKPNAKNEASTSCWLPISKRKKSLAVESIALTRPSITQFLYFSRSSSSLSPPSSRSNQGAIPEKTRPITSKYC